MAGLGPLAAIKSDGAVRGHATCQGWLCRKCAVIDA